MTNDNKLQIAYSYHNNGSVQADQYKYNKALAYQQQFRDIRLRWLEYDLTIAESLFIAVDLDESCCHYDMALMANRKCLNIRLKKQETNYL